MAVSVWPASLPQLLLVDGYGEGLGDGRLRSQMDVGPAKVRRRSSAIPRPLSGSMTMNASQILVARAFVEDSLLDGSLPFMFPLPLTGAPVLVRCGEALPSWSAMSHNLFRWTMTLEVLP